MNAPSGLVGASLSKSCLALQNIKLDDHLFFKILTGQNLTYYTEKWKECFE